MDYAHKTNLIYKLIMVL